MLSIMILKLMKEALILPHFPHSLFKINFLKTNLNKSCKLFFISGINIELGITETITVLLQHNCILAQTNPAVTM